MLAWFRKFVIVTLNLAMVLLLSSPKWTFETDRTFFACMWNNDLKSKRCCLLFSLALSESSSRTAIPKKRTQSIDPKQPGNPMVRQWSWICLTPANRKHLIRVMHLIMAIIWSYKFDLSSNMNNICRQVEYCMYIYIDTCFFVCIPSLAANINNRSIWMRVAWVGQSYMGICTYLL